MNDCKKLLEMGLTIKGTPFMTIAELKQCISFFWDNRVYVQTMEVHEIEGKQSYTNFSLGIHGLDGELNMEVHKDVNKAFSLLKKKILMAEKSTAEIRCIVWLDDWPASTP